MAVSLLGDVERLLVEGECGVDREGEEAVEVVVVVGVVADEGEGEVVVKACCTSTCPGFTFFLSVPTRDTFSRSQLSSDADTASAATSMDWRTRILQRTEKRRGDGK